MKNGTLFYIIGGVSLLLAAVMIYDAITYNILYLKSMEMSFSTMWFRNVKFIIDESFPYFIGGVISIGIGKIISIYNHSEAKQ